MANEYAVNHSDLQLIADEIRARQQFTVDRISFPNGFVSGLDDIFNTGYKFGSFAGYDEGYDEGYEQGTKEAPDTLAQKLTGKMTEYYNNVITSVVDFGFAYDKVIRSVDLPLVASVGNNCFYQNTNLQSVNLPLLETISAAAFGSCSNLKRLDFQNVKTIGVQAFSNCTSLNTLVLRKTSIASLGNTNAFTNTPIANGTGFVYVPNSLVDAYKTASRWSTYANQIKSISELEDNL